MASKAGNVLKGMRMALQFISKGKGFDRVVQRGEVIEGTPGRCLFAFKVNEEDVNVFGAMHGGLGATLVDVVTTLALTDAESGQLTRPGVSVDLSLSYVSAAKLGDDLLVDAKVSKTGSSLAFIDCEVRKKDDGKIVVKGSHIKFVGERSSRN